MRKALIVVCFIASTTTATMDNQQQHQPSYTNATTNSFVENVPGQQRYNGHGNSNNSVVSIMSTHSDQPSLASSVNGYSSYGNNRHTHAPNQNHQGHPAFAHDNNNRHHDAANNLLSMHGQGHGATPNANDNFAPPNHRYQYSQQTPHPPARQAMNGYPQTNVQGLLPHPSPLHDDNLPTPNDESVLEYPHDFFDAKGNLPKDAEAAKSKWKYRKSRPKHRSVCDDEPEPPTTADGEAMLSEMKDIRVSL